jgi:hypothetical protein
MIVRNRVKATDENAAAIARALGRDPSELSPGVVRDKGR